MSDRVTPEQIREAQKRHPLSSLIGRGVALKKRGGDYWGLCPFHKESTASFKVSDSRGAYYCFGCGAKGGAIGWVMVTENLDFVAAVTTLLDGTMPAVKPAPPRQEQEVEDQEDTFNVRLARRIWGEAVTIAHTPAEFYLRGRGITIPSPPSLRYHAQVLWGEWHRNDPEQNIYLPALIAGVQDPAGRVTAVHRIYLDPSTLANEAPQPWPLEPRKSLLGAVKGGAIRLTPIAARMGTAEGVETALSVVQAGLAPVAGFWCGIDTGHMAAIAWPEWVDRLDIYCDRDRADPNRFREFTRRDGSVWRRRNPNFGKRPGEEAGRRAAAAFLAARRGRIAGRAVPPGEKCDFNDLLRGQAA
jgi:DNA primase